ncbi:MAG: PhnD/SsuA/transferrin family substrate-binding protein [Desulfobacterales bacterium]|nr:PhnD/SsuA/transferrin family substrate-binding protein [Desulfobacterales bacterium]
MLRKLMLFSLMVTVALFFIVASKDNLAAKPGQSIEKEKIEVPQKHIAKEYELIISPCGKRSMMFGKFKVVSNYLSKTTDHNIGLFVPGSFEEFATRLKNKEADFLYIDPALYLVVENLIDKNNLYVFLCGFIDELKGKPLETGCIIARADSDIKNIKDVKGKRAIFGPRGSATKWVAARKLFTDNGIDLEKDLAGYSFGGTCIDIVLDIFYKKAEVGCVKTLMCPVCKPSIYYKHSGLDISKLSHVAQTVPVITGIFVCTDMTDVRDMGKVVDALAKIPELDVQERQTFPVDMRYGLVKVDNSAFDDLRRMAE